MAARVRLESVEAVFRDGRWWCSDPAIEEPLNSTVEGNLFYPSVPDSGNEAAHRAECVLGAEVLELNRARSVPGRVY